MNKPMNFRKALDKLKAEAIKGRAKRLDTVTSLPLMNLKLAVDLFQPRAKGGNKAASEAHIKTLGGCLKGTEPLEPLIVWWSGKAFYIIDGHHRYAAYKSVGGHWLSGAGVPVVEFKGTLYEAIGKATEANSKDKLPMTKDDKVNAAWRLTCLGGMSKSQLSSFTGVSDGLIGKMRKALTDLRQLTVKHEFLEHPVRQFEDELLAGWTWLQARTYLRDKSLPDFEIDHDRVRAEKFRDALVKQFGTQISKHPEAFAMALEMINSSLPQRLMETEAWSHLGGDEPEEDEDDI